jgi:hypothetical protein
MASAIKPAGKVRVTITKNLTRAAARKTLERLFMRDKAVSQPMAVRSANFKDLPKRRGGVIWTKRPNKLHPDLSRGAMATILATPQHLRDLDSAKQFVTVAGSPLQNPAPVPQRFRPPESAPILKPATRWLGLFANTARAVDPSRIAPSEVLLSCP